MSTERDPLFAPKPPSYPEQPPPYTVPHPSWGYPPSYAAPPPLQTQPYHGAAPHYPVIPVQEQPVARQFVVDVKPRNYVKLSIFVMICLSPLCGLLALICALKVDSAWAAGDRERARRSSAMAIGFNLAGIIISVVVIVAISVVAAFV